jgi:hypothetical protein
VLIEGPNDASESRFTGRSERHEIVHVEAAPGIDPTGQVVRATVREAFNHSLLGTMEGVTLPSIPKPRANKKLNVLSA